MWSVAAVHSSFLLCGVRLYGVILTHSADDGHLCYFQFGPVKNNAAVNILVYVFGLLVCFWLFSCCLNFSF